MTADQLESYRFYRMYHQDPINRLIHAICIPGISWSLCALLPPLHSLLLVGFYDAAYLYLFVTHLRHLEMTDFLKLSCFLIGIWGSGSLFHLYGPYHEVVAWSTFVFSWIMQFLGHALFEGNRPALLDSMHQSFLMAPLFAYFEIEDMFS